MNIDTNDIVLVNDTIVQYLGKEMENGVIVQDIYTKKVLVHEVSIKRKATRDEVKWFCENTEYINFIAPNSMKYN